MFKNFKSEIQVALNEASQKKLKKICKFTRKPQNTALTKAIQHFLSKGGGQKLDLCKRTYDYFFNIHSKADSHQRVTFRLPRRALEKLKEFESQDYYFDTSNLLADIIDLTYFENIILIPIH